MRQNTQHSESDDKQSLSTRVTPSAKSASFNINAKRQMFIQKTNQKNQVEKLYNNVLVLTPELSAYVISDQVLMLDDDNQFVVLHDGYYTLLADRAKPQMIPRTVQPQSELIFCEARKPGSTIFLQSLHSYSNKDYPSMIHINISKYNSQQFTHQSRNIHLPIPQQSTVLSFTTLENTKKCLLLLFHPQKKIFEFIYFSLMKQNKHKNSHFKHNKVRVKKFGEVSDEEDNEESKMKKQMDKQYIVENLQTVRKEFVFKREGEKFMKLINSEYGDALLLISNQQIYNIEIEGRDIDIKPIKIQEQIKLYKEQMLNIHEEPFKESVFIDVCYIYNGLKVLFITSNNYLGYIAAEKVVSLTLIPDQLNKKQRNKKYAENLQSSGLVSMIDRAIVRTNNNELIILKETNQSHKIILSVERVIELTLNPETDLHGYKFFVAPKSEEIVISKIVTNDEKKIMHLEVGKKSLMSPGNQFAGFYRAGYRNLESMKKAVNTNAFTQTQQRTPVVSLANGMACFIKDNEVNFLRIYEGFTTEKNTLEQLFTVSFFEKPLRVSMDPFASTVIILFKEFVKFFKFEYQRLQQFYTYNVRGVSYAGFSDSGQYILIAVDDMLYFINPYTFQTQKQIEAYGEIRSIKYFESSLYIILKNKVSSKSSPQQFIHCLLQNDGQYQKVSEIKLQPQQMYYMDRKQLIICSKKQIKIYYYDYFDQEIPIKRKLKLKIKEITLNDFYEYPTAVTLSEEFGVLFIGTNYGRVYQYLWPILDESEQYAPNEHYVSMVNNSEVSMIRVGTCLQKILTFAKSGMINQFQIDQYIEAEEMATPYIISPNTLYTPTLKYQFASRQYLYQSHTSYIQQYNMQSTEMIEELKFVLEKIKDDIEEQNTKANHHLKQSMDEIIALKEVDQVKMEKQFKLKKEEKVKRKEELNEDLMETIKKNDKVIEQETNKYEQKMLQLYKQADRLKGIAKDMKHRFRKQKDQYIVQNDKIKIVLSDQCAKQLEAYEAKFKGIQKTADQYQRYSRAQNEEQDIELAEYKKYRHYEIEADLEMEERIKQNLLGSIQQLAKQIANYKQRKDEFQSLTMETNLQIEQLHKDRVEYKDKRRYLQKELQEKQDMIQEKQKQLIVFVKNTETMKKIKNTHEFQLNEYEKEFEPMNVKLMEIENKIKNMNQEIFKEFNNRQAAQENIEGAKEDIYKLKRNRQQRILKKHTSSTKLNRLFSKLSALLEKDPLSLELRRKLNDLVHGQTFETNEEEVLQKEKNAKLMRKKDFIRKEIQEEEKREQQIVRNKNLYFHYYNDNTALVSYYNELKQEENRYLSRQEKILAQIEDIRRKIIAETPKKLKRADSGRSHSLLQASQKKNSEKLLTPYQRYEQQQVQLLWAKGNTQETRLGSISSRKNIESTSLLQTLVKQMGKSESTYEKMQVVRDRVRSFVNPQLRIRNKKSNMGVQRMLFETRKLVQEEGLQ